MKLTMTIKLRSEGDIQGQKITEEVYTILGYLETLGWKGKKVEGSRNGDVNKAYLVVEKES